MMGLMVLLFLAVYLVVFIWVVMTVLKWAAKNKRSGWWGVLAGFVMYNLVFWDWIPTLVMHKYYCETQAGFWVYKTPEQWMKENPGVLETLVNNKGAPSQRQGNMESYKDTYFLNQRFNWVIKREGKLFLNRWRHEQDIIDTKTSEVLATYIDFSTSQIASQAGWGGWKGWLANKHCSGGRRNLGLMYSFEDKVRGKQNDK